MRCIYCDKWFLRSKSLADHVRIDCLPARAWFEASRTASRSRANDDGVSYYTSPYLPVSDESTAHSFPFHSGGGSFGGAGASGSWDSGSSSSSSDSGSSSSSDSGSSS
jgi:uncharacterized membrane protein YgcG